MKTFLTVLFALFISCLGFTQSGQEQKVEKNKEQVIQDKDRISPEMDRLKTDEELNNPAPVMQFEMRAYDPSEIGRAHV